jgi:2-methylisocitrate lyase-like PEP mutase family enzyme
MTTNAERADHFLALHHGPTPLLLPNAWDAGSAKIFAAMGFQAIATTSGGHAGTLGRLDGAVTLDEAIAHVADLADATDLPVNADFENGFADAPADVAENVARVAAAGAGGCSIEDFNGNESDPFYDIGLAMDRVAAAAEIAHTPATRVVLTARAENHIHGHNDLGDTIKRLQSYQSAGADVLYAPGVSKLDDLKSLVESVDLPVNVLALPNAPSVAELGAIGIKRVSVGSGFARVALGAVVTAAQEFRDDGTYSWWSAAVPAAPLINQAFSR